MTKCAILDLNDRFGSIMRHFVSRRAVGMFFAKMIVTDGNRLDDYK